VLPASLASLKLADLKPRRNDSVLIRRGKAPGSQDLSLLLCCTLRQGRGQGKGMSPGPLDFRVRADGQSWRALSTPEQEKGLNSNLLLVNTQLHRVSFSRTCCIVVQNYTSAWMSKLCTSFKLILSIRLGVTVCFATMSLLDETTDQITLAASFTELCC
jgi:hypothetical protein